MGIFISNDEFGSIYEYGNHCLIFKNIQFVMKGSGWGMMFCE